MFIFSIKQLLRQPGKTLLFFLLMAASTALVVTGAVLTIENNRRVQIVDATYSTVGYVEQKPLNVESTAIANPCFGTDTVHDTDYGEYIAPEDLDFPGAAYIHPPEHRPYYFFYQEDFDHSEYSWIPDSHILEFTPLESIGDDGSPVEVEITKVLYSDVEGKSTNERGGAYDRTLSTGERITLCQCFGTTRYPLEVGEKYVAILYLYWHCPEHDADEYVVYMRPHSHQQDRKGNYIDKGSFPDEIDWGYSSPYYAQISHVTGDDFYEEGNPGYRYLQWITTHEKFDDLFSAVATNSLNLFSSWHEGNIALADGREISKEEFDTGAFVCMIPKEFAHINQLSVGDKVNLPLLCSVYRDLSTRDGMPPNEFSTINAEGEFYEPFWEQEYEIVGTYQRYGSWMEVGQDMFIIPSKSVQASDENNIAWHSPMQSTTASFEIPNGTIQKFDTALKEHVPEAERLDITYDDRGYSEIMKSLNNSRGIALLLLLAGIMAALSIVALLLYFFVAKEKKRTAIERSLGMTKHQCRVSLLSALLILTVLSASVGSVCGILTISLVREPGAVAETVEEWDNQYAYDTRYSTWAVSRELAEKAEIEVEPPVFIYYAVPFCLCLLAMIFALILMAGSFRTDPIYLLSTREKE